MTMTSFESAFPPTKSVTLQEEKTWEPGKNTTQGQKERHQTEHRSNDTCQQMGKAHKQLQ